MDLQSRANKERKLKSSRCQISTECDHCKVYVPSGKAGVQFDCKICNVSVQLVVKPLEVKVVENEKARDFQENFEFENVKTEINDDNDKEQEKNPKSDSIAKENMEKVMSIEHIREQIFGDFDHETLETCRQVCEDWKFWIDETKLGPMKYMLEFGDKKHEDEDDHLVGTFIHTSDIDDRMVKDVIPGWCKAVKKFAKISSLEDLKEVKESLKIVKQELGIWRFLGGPFNLAAEFGHVKLLKFLLYTDFDIYEQGQFWIHPDDGVRDVGDTRFICYTPFMAACDHGQTRVVKFMIDSSKKFDFDINAIGGLYPKTGFMIACEKGHTEVVKMILESSKQYGIDINETGDNVCDAYEHDWTGFEHAWKYGRIEVVKLLFENHLKYDIPLQDWWFPSFETGSWGSHITNKIRAEMKKMKAIIKAAQRKKKHEMEETDASRSKKAKYEIITID